MVQQLNSGELSIASEGAENAINAFQAPVQINESAFAFASQFGITGPESDISVLDYGAFTSAEGVLVTLPSFQNDLSTYTAVWDMQIDGLAVPFQSLLQTNIGNTDDGELFIRSDGGVGINGNYDGAVTPEVWARIAITVEDQGDSTATLTKYLDGVLLDTQTVESDRFTLPNEGVLLLNDDNNETSTGYLAHFGVASRVLTPGEIVELGTVRAAGPFEAAGQPQALQLTFDSHWRPFDNQTARISAIFGEADPVEIFRYDSTNTNDTDQRNESVTVDFAIPADASSVSFTFEYGDADNDWFWAIDNITLSEGTELLYAENFDGLGSSLVPAVDEAIPAATLGWTQTPPEGWTRENDPNMPQGTTEWQGWSFATREFWTSADQQAREEFTKGTGVIAIADGDEWDDFNVGSGTGDEFTSVLTTPEIELSTTAPEARTYQLGFDNYQPTVEFGFESVEVIDEPPVAENDDLINDLLLREGTAPTVINLTAVFGAGSTDFAVTTTNGETINAAITDGVLSLTPGELGHADVVVTAAAANGTPLEENFRAIVAGENAYVFAVLPDTQSYTSTGSAEIRSFFGNMTDWLVEQKDTLAIQHVIHVGDVTDNNNDPQWLIAEDALERLDGELTYTLAVGNHDQAVGGTAANFDSLIDEYFTIEQLGVEGTYDGYPEPSLRNSFQTLTTPDGTDWLILSLEFGAPDDVLRWASEVIEDHLDHRVILDTHSWNGGDKRVDPTTEPLTGENGGWGYGIRNDPRGVNDGEDIWRELVSKYPNMTFTFNGHNFLDGAETVVSYAAGDNPVHQIFVNYQNGISGEITGAGDPSLGGRAGNGALRLVVLDPDNDRITTYTKFVELDTYFDRVDHQEVFEGVELGAPEQIAIAKAGDTLIAQADGLTTTVSLDPSATLGDTAESVFEWFAADGEKLGATDGAALNVDLEVGTHRLTLRVTDADGNVSEDDQLVIVETPNTLLTETFDDGDIAGWASPKAPPTFLDLGTDLTFVQPAIDTSTGQIALELQFDSHWRPFDQQTGTVAVSFDGGAPIEILRYDLTNTDDTAQRNETIIVPFLAPASASDIEVLWRYDDADNDWYWAVDNIELRAIDEDGITPIWSENFDGLATELQPAVDEEIAPSVLGWTHTTPDGWTRTVNPASPQGATEWRGWSFTTPAFWTSAAAQARAEFSKGTGVFAVADGDEWDDFNGGAGGNTNSLDTSIGSPALSLAEVGGGQAAGTESGIARVASLSGDEAVLVTPAASGRFNEYTLIFDVLVDDADALWTAFFQTDVTNAGDAEIYLQNAGDGTGGIGISGQYDGAFAYDAWNRVAFSFVLDGNAQVLNKYINGIPVGTQVVDDDVTDGSRWTIDASAGLLLFSEPAGFTSEIYANAVAFTPEVLDEEVIAALGGVDVDGPLDSSTNPDAFQFNFNGALDKLDFGDADIEAINLGDAETSFLVKGSIFSNPNGEGEAALYAQTDGPNELLFWDGEGSQDWTTYVYSLTLEAADNDTVGALFYYVDEQTHYELALNQEENTRTLTRVENGVATVLAEENGSYRHFAAQDLRIAVIDDRITITLDDELLFGGPVIDGNPLSGGTIGVLSRLMDRALFDNIAVNTAELSARALGVTPAERWAVDLDGDGTAPVNLTATATISTAAIASYEWLINDAIVATGENPALDLPPGETTVILRVTDALGAVAEDQITVNITAQDAILAADDFEDGTADGWAIIDEGTIDAPSNWAVIDGAFVQDSDIQSTQQERGFGAWSLGGEGADILRDGTYAVYDAPEALNWTDYAVETTITPGDDDGIGLLFRYTDAENYYKLEADAQSGVIQLTRHEGGYETVLARAWNEYTVGDSQNWRITAQDGVLTTWIDGTEVFGSVIDDRTHTAGTIALYSWGSTDLAFDNIVVTDLLIGGPGDDEVAAGAGDDTAAGGLGNDLIYGGDGNDMLRGDRNSRQAGGVIGGDDTIFGGAGNDRIGGKGGDDALFGDDGNDAIWGDDGDDLLRGGLGNDTLTGDDFSSGSGADTFVLAAGEGTDTITDFEVGIDFIGLADGLTFEALSFSGNTISTSDETLAILRGVDTTALAELNFVIV